MAARRRGGGGEGRARLPEWRVASFCSFDLMGRFGRMWKVLAGCGGFGNTSAEAPIGFSRDRPRRREGAEKTEIQSVACAAWAPASYITCEVAP
jgi:hypothetical protein